MEKSDLPEKNKKNSVKKSTVRKKRPTLSQQVEDQAKLIDGLYNSLHNKELEIQGLLRKNKSIDELNESVAEIEKLLQSYGVKNQHAFNELNVEADTPEKLQELEIKLKASGLQSKHLSAQNIVKSHMVAGSALSLLPIPLFDLAALSGTQLNLLRFLCKHYDVNFDEQIGESYFNFAN